MRGFASGWLCPIPHRIYAYRLIIADKGKNFNAPRKKNFSRGFTSTVYFAKIKGEYESLTEDES